MNANTKTKPQPESITTTVAEAITTAFSTIEELAEEMRKAYDNTPESLQNSGAGEARGEAADALEGIEEPEAPGSIQDLAVVVSQLPLKRKASRGDRLAHGLAYAYAAIEALENHTVEEPAPDAEGREPPKDNGDGTLTEYVDDAPGTLGARIMALIEGQVVTEVTVRDDRGGSGAITLTYEAPTDSAPNTEEQADDIQSLIEEVQTMIDEAEGVTFPGFMG